MVSKAILKLAAQLDAKLQREYAEYLESCEIDIRNGYRPHYCEHGMSRWTDYDNICGYCEDGISMSDGLVRMAFALDNAKQRWERANEILDFITNAKAKGFGDFVDTEKAFVEFARHITV